MLPILIGLFITLHNRKYHC